MLPLPPPAGTSHPRSPGEPACSVPARSDTGRAGSCRRFPLLPSTGSTPPKTLGDQRPGGARGPGALRSRSVTGGQEEQTAGGLGGTGLERRAAPGRSEGGLQLPACRSLPRRAGPGHAGMWGPCALRELPALPQSPWQPAAVLLPAHEDSEPRWRVSLERPRFPQGVPRRRR